MQNRQQDIYYQRNDDFEIFNRYKNLYAVLGKIIVVKVVVLQASSKLKRLGTPSHLP